MLFRSAVYESYLDIYFNKNSEERLKASKAQDLATHLPYVCIRKVCNQQYELVAGYRQYHLAESLGIESLPVLIVEDMAAEDLFEFAITNCVVPLLGFDTKESKATNKQLREFYSSLLSNLGNGFSDLLRSSYLSELLDIPRSHLRRPALARKSALELQRKQVETALSSELDSQNIMSKFSLRDLHTTVEAPAIENGDSMRKGWVQYLSKHQVLILKKLLSETPQKTVSVGDLNA